MKKFRLNRRDVLRGVGVTLSLPLLEAMLPVGKSAFAATDTPKRFIAYYCPNGVWGPSWKPSGSGADFQLSKTLQPLAAVKEDILVLSGLDNKPQLPHGNGYHAAATGSFLTASRSKPGDVLNAKSLDQVIADKIGRTTRLPSLELGMEGGDTTGDCDFGYSCAHLRNISWKTATNPLPKMIGPKHMFGRLFGGSNSGTGIDLARQKQDGRLILDYVKDDAKALQAKLGYTDRIKVEEYFTSLETLERQFAQSDNEEATLACLSQSGQLSETNELDAKAQQMMDLMVLAFECDITRVQSFMLANSRTDQQYRHLGIYGSHHNLSHEAHHGGNKGGAIASLEKIDHWQVQKFAYLINKLKTRKDIAGNALLDSTCAFFSNEFSDGNAHSYTNKPIVLAGNCNGYFKTGRHIDYGSDKVSNLFMSILDAFDTPLAKFGDDSTGLLANLRA